MQNIKVRFISNIILFFLIYALMLYVVSRALSLVITHDEAYSFYNVKHFWYVETLCTGNTHWFNFVAIKTAILLGLEKVSQLRWFSLLSAGVFFTVAYFWIKTINNISVKFFAFAFLLLNPYLIDYLSLARGYATGLMFESLAILCICISLNKEKRNVGVLALFFAGMAAIANFNFFYFFASFSIIYFYKFHFINGFTFIKHKLFYLEFIYTLTITYLVLRALQFITICSNDIGKYGGSELISSLFTGYIDTFIYNKFDVSSSAINTCAHVLFIVIMVVIVFGVFGYKKHKIIWYRFASSAILIMIALMVFNKLSFDVLYPTYRTTLMLYPLIALVIVGFVSFIVTAKKLKSILLYSCSALLLAHFVNTINISRSFDYYHQEDSKQCFEYLKSMNAKRVGLSGELFGVFRNYYQMTNNYKYPFDAYKLNTDVVYRNTQFDGNVTINDFIVLFPPYNMNYYKNSNLKLKALKFYKSSGTLILKVY